MREERKLMAQEGLNQMEIIQKRSFGERQLTLRTLKTLQKPTTTAETLLQTCTYIKEVQIAYNKETIPLPDTIAIK